MDLTSPGANCVGPHMFSGSSTYLPMGMDTKRRFALLHVFSLLLEHRCYLLGTESAIKWRR